MYNIKKTKKAQLSIETMILYGLIALVALSAVAALIYFDVLNLGRYLPDTCNLGGTGDLKCEEWKVSSSPQSIEFGVRNVGQKAIEYIEIDITDNDGTHFTGTLSGEWNNTAGELVAPGDIVGVSISGVSGLQPGRALEGRLSVRYMYKDGAIEQESAGKIRIKVS